MPLGITSAARHPSRPHVSALAEHPLLRCAIADEDLPIGQRGGHHARNPHPVPALAEHPLLKGYDLVGWFAMAAPKNLPPAWPSS